MLIVPCSKIRSSKAYQPRWIEFQLLPLMKMTLNFLESNKDIRFWRHIKVPVFYASRGLDKSELVASIFSDQGSQYVNMGKFLYEKCRA